MKTERPEVEIVEFPVKNGTIAILRGGLSSPTPKKFMDERVKEYVGKEPYSEFVGIELDNPWVRIVVKGINDLDFEDFGKLLEVKKQLIPA